MSCRPCIARQALARQRSEPRTALDKEARMKKCTHCSKLLPRCKHCGVNAVHPNGRCSNPTCLKLQTE
jgi:hypothetical protein